MKLDHASWISAFAVRGFPTKFTSLRRPSLALLIVLLFSTAPLSASRADNDNGKDLLEATYVGDILVVGGLLAVGTNVDHQNDNGWTALMAASRNGHAEIVEILLANGADVPAVEIIHSDNGPCPHTTLGTRGVDEGTPGSVPGALGNAVSDALSPFGVEVNELPIRPHKLWREIQMAKAKQAAD